LGKFKKGRSGNPNGRPKGVQDKRVALRSLLEPHAPALVAKVVEKALQGDSTALRTCLDRLIPPMRARDAPISIGHLEGSLSKRGEAVLDAVACGHITPDEATALVQAISAQARIVEVDELERRVKALEEKQHASN